MDLKLNIYEKKKVIKTYTAEIRFDVWNSRRSIRCYGY